ncbi:MAG TPA: DNA-3-methyladenine glycosylase I [Holophagaceae bacterium]|nr:DNA-3-methyladenine glycosylase I [Holophagaceae bacterium]
MDRPRCAWCTSDPLYIAYHDEEWGVPVHDDRALFEFLLLEGAQAGLSWITILRKREAYRRAFEGFDPATVAAFSDAKLEALLQDEGIVRNRLKIASARVNAQAFLRVQAESGSFAAYAWGFVGGAPKVNHRPAQADVPAVTPEAQAFSKDLLKRGFKFVGPTIVYAYMQATGMVDDHIATCWKRRG